MAQKDSNNQEEDTTSISIYVSKYAFGSTSKKILPQIQGIISKFVWHGEKRQG